MEGVFRDLEDIKLQLCAMEAHDGPIDFTPGCGGHVAEGEALLHPRLFEILELIRRKYFYNELCFFTNGSMLDEAFLKELARFRPIELRLSMHSTKPELWAKIFSKKERDALTAIAAPPLLKRYGIKFLGSIVPLPRLCGWEDLERTYEYFVTNGANRILLYWPAFSARTPESVVKDLAFPLEEFTGFAQRMKSRFSTRLEPCPNMVEPLRVRVETIIAKTLNGNPKTRGGAYQCVVWLASRAAFERLEKMVAGVGASAMNRHQVVAVDNLSYQGSIIVAGLLMVDDFINAGRGAMVSWPDADLFLVPALPFDSLCRDLKGTPAYRIAESLGRPVWLVEENGTLDTQLSFRIVGRHKTTASRDTV
jgi:hypothetical protein